MIKLCEVGLRDGLQNEKQMITTEQKVTLITKLIDAGVKKFEAVSFVNPKVVPQMADAEDVIKNVPKVDGITFAGLVLSQSGLARALKTQIDTINIVMATSDEFNMKNARRTVNESVRELSKVAMEARDANKSITVTLGTAFGCPFEGSVSENRLIDISEVFLKAGVKEITLADTTGLANPVQVKSIVNKFKNNFNTDLQLGLHFHNTRGLGLANVLAGYQSGVRHFDSSIGGLGGCPFAPQSVGNVCTEDMVNMFEEMGIETGTKLDELVDTALWMEQQMNKTLDGMLMKVKK